MKKYGRTFKTLTLLTCGAILIAPLGACSKDVDPDKIYDLDFSKDEELDDVDEDEEEDEELEVDGVLYDATCPSCGEEITFDEETLEKGSIRCPNCGEELEFDLGEDE